MRCFVVYGIIYLDESGSQAPNVRGYSMPNFPDYVPRAKPVSAPSPLVCDLTGEIVPVALETDYRGQTYTLSPRVYEHLVLYGFGASQEVRQDEERNESTRG